MSLQTPSAQDQAPETVEKNYRFRVALCFSLFALFFIFYMGTAIIQTPTFKAVAGIAVMGLPLGMLLSLAIFPISFLLIAVFFIFWR